MLSLANYMVVHHKENLLGLLLFCPSEFYEFLPVSVTSFVFFDWANPIEPQGMHGGKNGSPDEWFVLAF